MNNSSEQQEQQQNSKKVVTFTRNIRSQSSSQFSNSQLPTTKITRDGRQKNQSISYKDLIDLLNNSQTKEKNVNAQSTSRDNSRRSSYFGKHSIEDHVSRDDQKEDINLKQKEKIEVENLQEWINLKKFGKKSSYQEQIENIININEVRSRPDIRTDMIDDIMNSSSNNNDFKSENIAKKKFKVVDKKDGYTPSSLADKNFYKSSDYAKSYITNKNLLNQILQKKMKQLTEEEEQIITKRNQESTFSHTDHLHKSFTSSMNISNYLKTTDNFQITKNNNVRFDDTLNQMPGEVMTLKKLLSQNNAEQNKNMLNNYSMNQLQKQTNNQAKQFINKFSGLQHFKRDICKSIIDYNAIRDVIISQKQDKTKQKETGDNIRRSSSSQTKIITLYQPDYPLDKYKKKKNSAQEETDPFIKQEEQEKIQQYEAILEISSTKKNEFLQQKASYKQKKERVIQLGLQIIQLTQQIKQAKQFIYDYTSKMDKNLQKLSANKKLSGGVNKNSRGIRYSSTDHDRTKLQFNQIDEEQDDALITFSQFNQDYPSSPLKHKIFQKLQKDKKYSEFEEIEDAIELKKVDLKGMEKKLQETNITIERLKEDLHQEQKNKKDTLFDLKKLYQIFMKNPENWKYDKINWMLNEMQQMKQGLTDEYFPHILDHHSKQYLKQIQVLKTQDQELDANWIKWKNEYRMDKTITEQIGEKSYSNLMDKIKRKIKLIRQSNIEISVKRKTDRPQCKITLNKLMEQAHDIMNQDKIVSKREIPLSQLTMQESDYNEQKKSIQNSIDSLTKQEVNRLFARYPISSTSALTEIKSVFYVILPEFLAKRFSKKYQLLCESSKIQEQKNKNRINYEELREKITSSLNKTASMKVVSSSSQSKRIRAISKDSATLNNLNNTTQQQQQTQNTSSQTISQLNKTDSTHINIKQLDALNLPFLNLFDFYDMKTPQGNYVVV